MVPTRQQLAPACPVLVGVQGLDRAGDEMCPPPPDMQPLPVLPASSSAGVGLPGAAGSTPAQEEMPAVSRAVSQALFTSTKIQIG